MFGLAACFVDEDGEFVELLPDRRHGQQVESRCENRRFQDRMLCPVEAYEISNVFVQKNRGFDGYPFVTIVELVHAKLQRSTGIF